VSGGQELSAVPLHVSGDPSSAAYWMAAALVAPQSKIEINDVLLNPTRTGFMKVLNRMGAGIGEEILNTSPEPSGRVCVSHGGLKGTKVRAEEIPFLIDEIPILAVLGAYANGITEIRGAKELRIKESDRIEAVATNLRRMGAELEVFEDGLCIEGPQRLRGACLDSFGDHRIAMAFAIAALGADGDSEIQGAQCVAISYPNFFATLETLKDGS